MDKKEYEELQKTGSAWTSRAKQYHERLADAVNQVGQKMVLRDKVVFDVGANDGSSLLLWLASGARPLGLEFDTDKVRYAVKEGLPMLAWNIDTMDQECLEVIMSENSQFPTMADLVFCSHTLEHSNDCLRATKNLSSFVKPGGYLLIIVPFEEQFPTANPSHTSWMHNERLFALTQVLSHEGFMVDRSEQFRLEQEVWLWCKRLV